MNIDNEYATDCISFTRDSSINSSHTVKEANEYQTRSSHKVINVTSERMINPQFEDLSNTKIATLTMPLNTKNRLPPIETGSSLLPQDVGMLSMESIVINHCSQIDDTDRSICSGKCYYFQSV